MIDATHRNSDYISPRYDVFYTIWTHWNGKFSCDIDVFPGESILSKNAKFSGVTTRGKLPRVAKSSTFVWWMPPLESSQRFFIFENFRAVYRILHGDISWIKYDLIAISVALLAIIPYRFWQTISTFLVSFFVTLTNISIVAELLRSTNSRKTSGIVCFCRARPWIIILEMEVSFPSLTAL